MTLILQVLDTNCDNYSCIDNDKYIYWGRATSFVRNDTTKKLEGNIIANPYAISSAPYNYCTPTESYNRYEQRLKREINLPRRNNSKWFKHILDFYCPRQLSNDNYYLIHWSAETKHAKLLLAKIKAIAISDLYKRYSQRSQDDKSNSNNTDNGNSDASLPKSGNINDGNKRETQVNLSVGDNYRIIPNISVSSLNHEQLELFNLLQNTSTNLVVNAAGGTGKTYTIGKWIEKNKGKKILCLAPTHKALKVLKDNISSSNVDFMTTASALGIAPNLDKRNDKGEAKFEVVRTGRLNSYNDKTILVIDEFSMLSRYEYYQLETFYNNHRIVFLGDMAQLPPINDNFKDERKPYYQLEPNKCIIENIVRQNLIEEYNLTKVMRYDGVLLEYLTKLRQHILSNKCTFEYSHRLPKCDQIVQTRNTAKFCMAAVKLFRSEEYKNNKDFCKVIAYRNDIVRSYNTNIRNILYPDTELFYAPGELLLVNCNNKQIFTPIRRSVGYVGDYEKFIMWNVYDEFLVEESKVILGNEIDEDRIDELYNVNELYKLENFEEEIKYVIESFKGLRFYELGVSTVSMPTTLTIYTIHEADMTKYVSIVKKIRKICKEGGKSFWRLLDFIKELNDNVVHGYAITANASQGSSYNHVLADVMDIWACNNVEERDRRYYVALSRAKEKIYV